MSAADRLRGLVEEMTPNPRATGWNLVDWDAVGVDRDGFVALRNALPALIAVVDCLKRIREWDMLNSYVGGDGERHEPTADAPYWCGEIDRVTLALNDALGGEQ